MIRKAEMNFATVSGLSVLVVVPRYSDNSVSAYLNEV